MKRIKEILGYVEIVGFFASWFLILSGFCMYLEVRLGYQADHNYALAGAIIIIPGAMLAMIIHFMRWQFAGKKWHLPFLAVAAFFFYESLELLHLPQVGLNPYEPIQEAMVFTAFLFVLHVVRVIWMRYNTPDSHETIVVVQEEKKTDRETWGENRVNTIRFGLSFTVLGCAFVYFLNEHDFWFYFWTGSSFLFAAICGWFQWEIKKKYLT